MLSGEVICFSLIYLLLNENPPAVKFGHVNKILALWYSEMHHVLLCDGSVLLEPQAEPERPLSLECQTSSAYQLEM